MKRFSLECAVWVKNTPPKTSKPAKVVFKNLIDRRGSILYFINMFPKKAPILIVDDMSGARGLMKKHLESMGYQAILEAKSGEDALAQLQKAASQDPVQLIISDWKMPVMSGLELLAKVKSDPKWMNLPFLMVTSESDSAQIVSAIQLKVSDYIIKPFASDKLFKVLASIWAKHNPQRS